MIRYFASCVETLSGSSDRLELSDWVSTPVCGETFLTPVYRLTFGFTLVET